MDSSSKIKCIKSMNLENKKMSLLNNHKAIMMIFDAINKVLNNEFDCYYTGGPVLFINNNDKLERYHNDLDLFVNENQLIELKDRINSTSCFKFKSNMSKKGVNGHEYKIVCNDFPISVGLFLFERAKNGGITTKKYYYDDLIKMEQLYVDERHFNQAFSQLVFNNETFMHNNYPYKMVRPEYIFYSKTHLKPAREKDCYDIKYIENKIDLNLVNAINTEKQKKKDVIHKKIDQSVIIDLEDLLQKK